MFPGGPRSPPRWLPEVGTRGDIGDKVEAQRREEPAPEYRLPDLRPATAIPPGPQTAQNLTGPACDSSALQRRPLHLGLSELPLGDEVMEQRCRLSHQQTLIISANTFLVRGPVRPPNGRLKTQ